MGFKKAAHALGIDALRINPSPTVRDPTNELDYKTGAHIERAWCDPMQVPQVMSP